MRGTASRGPRRPSMDSPIARRALLVLLAAALTAAASVVLVASPARAGTAVVFIEDFESGALGPPRTPAAHPPAPGPDFWAVTNFANGAGNSSAWAAEVGPQSRGDFCSVPT